MRQLITKTTINLSPPQILALLYVFMIITGGALLMLPFATTEPISWLSALFTATSASTVTGLNVVDPGSTYTLFGQIVILFLIQIGGLGIMTFAVLVVIMLGKKIGLKQRLVIQQALNQTSIGGVIKLVKVLLIFSLSFEIIISFMLAIRWVPEMGWGKGIYYSIFHTISAFNNAGFALWPDGLSRYVNDPVVNILITVLFIVGGLGFTVIIDLWYSKEFRNLSLHSKIMLVGTFFINVIAIILIFMLEYHNSKTIGNEPFITKLLASYFQAVSPRTAGFNTIDIGSMKDSSLFLTIILMFIGAGSASTGGGIKVTTFVVLLLSVKTFIKGKNEAVIFNRTIGSSIFIKSLAITLVSASFVVIAIFILSITEKFSFLQITYEVVSAFGTTGLTMGITGNLSAIGQLVIMFMMIIGKIGPLTLIFSIATSKENNIRYPNGDVLIG